MAEEMLLTKELAQQRNGDSNKPLPENGAAVSENGAAQTDLQLSSPQETLAHLLKLGRAKGFVSYDEVLQVLPEAEK